MPITHHTIHDEFLKGLLDLQKKGVARKVRLVSRLREPQLKNAPGDPFLVFIPDLHLLSHDGEKDFEYHFLRNSPANSINRDLLLRQFCEGLEELQRNLSDTSPKLKVVQLGDFLDLWRESHVTDGSPEDRTEKILRDNPVVAKYLSGARGEPAVLKPDILIGNHDDELRTSPAFDHFRMAFTYKAGSADILAVHGHQFDDGEMTQSGLNAVMVELFASGATPHAYKADRTKLTAWGPDDKPIGTPPRIVDPENPAAAFKDDVNVWEVASTCFPYKMLNYHELLWYGKLGGDRIREGSEKFLKRFELDAALPNLKLIVVGHSHLPRICRYVQKTSSNQSFVFMDCGAWIESLRFPDGDTVPTCTIGALADGDLRIYQLDPVERELL